MPFPLAHPAAVLPLRRFCPRYLNFPALILGSLSPDAGYAFGSLNVPAFPYGIAEFSHQPLAGTFGFCLPVGLVLVLIFYMVRLPVVRLLPAGHRRALLPLCRQPVGHPLVIAVSLLVGAWTHQMLDALTHPEFWLVRYLPVLLSPVLSVGRSRLLVCDVLYTGCTFFGVAWLALAYLNWWEQATGATVPRGMKWCSALLLAGAVLCLALACRGNPHWIGVVPAGMGSGCLVIGFLLATGWWFKSSRSPQ